MKAYKMAHSKALEVKSTTLCLKLSTKDREIKNNTKQGERKGCFETTSLTKRGESSTQFLIIRILVL
jgi:hypothetical protein